MLAKINNKRIKRTYACRPLRPKSTPRPIKRPALIKRLLL